MSMIYHVSKRLFRNVSGKEMTDEMIIDDYTYLKYTHTLAFDFDVESGIMYVGYSKINESEKNVTIEVLEVPREAPDGEIFNNRIKLNGAGSTD